MPHSAHWARPPWQSPLTPDPQSSVLVPNSSHDFLTSHTEVPPKPPPIGTRNPAAGTSRSSGPASLGLWLRSSQVARTLLRAFSFIVQLNQFGAKHILKCQPTYLVHGMRNARFSENAMFGLDFVLECGVKQTLNPSGVI